MPAKKNSTDIVTNSKARRDYHILETLEAGKEFEVTMYFAESGTSTDYDAGMTVDEIFEITKIDRWFLVQIQQIVDCEEELASTVA